MRQKPKASILTTDGQMIEICSQVVAENLFQNCITKTRNDHFIQIKTKNNIRFIPTHQIKEVIFYAMKQEVKK